MLPPPRPGYPTKLQSCWQGPFIIVKCLEGNTYRIRHPKKFRKRLLRHRDQLRVLHTRPERLQSTHGENLTGPPTVVPTTLSPGLTVSMPPQSRQVDDNAIPEDALLPYTNLAKWRTVSSEKEPLHQTHIPEILYAPGLTLLHQMYQLLT